MAGEKKTEEIGRLACALREVLDATGVGTWPYNSDDENFMEYMTGLSLSITHLFKQAKEDRVQYVNGVRARVGLPGIVFKKNTRPVGWLKTDLDEIQERFSGREHPSFIVYRPQNPVVYGWQPTPFDHLYPPKRLMRRIPDVTSPALVDSALNVTAIRNCASRTFDGSFRRCYEIYAKPRFQKRNYFSGDADELGRRAHEKLSMCSAACKPSERAVRTAVKSLNGLQIIRTVNVRLSRSVDLVPAAVINNRLDALLFEVPAYAGTLIIKHAPDGSFCRAQSPQFFNLLALLQNVSLTQRREDAMVLTRKKYHVTRFPRSREKSTELAVPRS